MHAIPLRTRVMAPLGDVLHRGIVVQARDEDALSDGMVCVEFTPPIPIEPAGSIIYITCPTKDVTLGWF
jgi:hypothetical protein